MPRGVGAYCLANPPGNRPNFSLNQGNKSKSTSVKKTQIEYAGNLPEFSLNPEKTAQFRSRVSGLGSGTCRV
eukprot:3941338-Rhodomonas_salina.1